MPQHKHCWNTERLVTRRASLLVLLGASALLAMLIVAGRGVARAAPQSGGPSLSISSIDGNTLTLQFDNWSPGQTITLSYSATLDCSASQPLPNDTISASASSFQANYTWPSSGIRPGTYHLCATDPVDGAIASTQTVTVSDTGSVQPTPTVPGSTPTSASGSPTPTASTSTATPGSNSPGATSTPGSKGTSVAAPGDANGGNTLVAIIVLCLLVMLLLVYLIRLWLQGRQSSGQPPAGGQQGP